MSYVALCKLLHIHVLFILFFFYNILLYYLLAMPFVYSFAFLLLIGKDNFYGRKQFSADIR